MLINYFNKFPLLGKKFLDYEHWYEILSNKNNYKGVKNLNMDIKNRKSLLDKNLSYYLPNLNLSNKRNFSTSSDLQEKIKSNVYLSPCTDLVVLGKNLPSGVGWGWRRLCLFTPPPQSYFFLYV